MQSPYWIGFGDIHENTSRLKEIPGLRDAAGVIVSGDITIGGSVKQAERVLEAVCRYNSVIMAQIGNMDRGDVTGYLEQKGWNIHATGREIATGVGVFGVGTSTFTPFGTPSEFPESRIADWLDTAHRSIAHCRRKILVCHTPPYGTACDKLPNGQHVGSEAVRDFLMETQPDICLCGHIHEARSIEQLGRTTVVNPGTLASGGYVVITGDESGVSVELKTL